MQTSFPFCKEQCEQLIHLLQNQNNYSACCIKQIWLTLPQLLRKHTRQQQVRITSTCSQTAVFNIHSDPPWILDSGATDHILCSTSAFTISSAISSTVRLPNGTSVSVTHVGSIQLTPSLILTNVLCVPTFHFDLISVSQLTKSHIYCLMISRYCFIQDRSSWKAIGLCEQ